MEVKSIKKITGYNYVWVKKIISGNPCQMFGLSDRLSLDHGFKYSIKLIWN